MNKAKIEATFVIPTYNSEEYIEKCLKSIQKQTYSKEKYEVLILDGGSTDKTLKIVNEYKKALPLKILNNEKIDAESGKYRGIKASKGEFIILLDSDNEIVNKNWLATGVDIMKKHREIWGLESPWMVNSKDPLINQYFALLKIADPVARLLNPSRIPEKTYDGYKIYKLKRNDVVVTGANGFFWRKSVIITFINNKSGKFEEVNFVSRVTEKGVSYFAILNRIGIYHYYCDSLSNYFGKRKKIATKFTKRKELRQKTWLESVPKAKFLFSILYSFSVVGPLIEAVVNIVKSRNIAWVYHPLISFITIIIYTYIFVKKTVIFK